MLKPVQKQSVSDSVYDQIAGEILSGRMEPGAALPSERGLAEMLGVNRGAVREALKRLSEARLVVIQHGGATRVLDYREVGGLDLLGSLLLSDGVVDLEIARSVVELKSIVAPDAARLAARRGGPATADALDDLVECMRKAAGDVPVLQALALDFWKSAIRGSGNVAYRLLHNSLERTYRHLMAPLAGVLADEVSDIDGYAAIARAVRDGDEAAAAERAHAIVRLGEARILPFLDALAVCDAPSSDVEP